MRYDLDDFETFFQKISPDSLKQTKQPGQLGEWIDFVNDEISKIRKNLRETLFETNNSQIFELIIKSHQRTINHMASVLAEYKQLLIKEKGNNKQYLEFYDTILNMLDRLLNYLVIHFDSYYDTNLAAPASYCILRSNELREKIKIIESDFSTTNVNETLLNTALEPIRSFVDNPDGSTYLMIDYLLELAEQLLRTNQEDEMINRMVRYYNVLMSQLRIINHLEEEVNVRLHVSMLHINFNNPRYINLCVSSLWQKLMERIVDSEKVLFLRMYKKMMKQILQKPGFSLFPGLQRATNVIAEWVTEELEFLQVNESFVNDHVSTLNGEGGDLKKINTNLSRSELITLTKLFTECNIIRVNSQMDVLRKVGEFFTTKGSDNLNANTLRGHYYNKPSQQTIDSLKDKLISCLNVLRSW